MKTLQEKTHTTIMEALRTAMRTWTSGVTIVSAAKDGISHGMTVSAFTSLSLEPPLVMVSLNKDTRTHTLVLESQAFGVTILAEGQEAISERFAGNQAEYEEERFAGLETFTLQTGSPLLPDGLAVLDCRLVTTYDAGDHTIMVGEVLVSQVLHNAQPLVYHDRSYRRLEGE